MSSRILAPVLSYLLSDRTFALVRPLYPVFEDSRESFDETKCNFEKTQELRNRALDRLGWVAKRPSSYWEEPPHLSRAGRLRECEVTFKVIASTLSIYYLSDHAPSSS